MLKVIRDVMLSSTIDFENHKSCMITPPNICSPD